MPLLPTFEALTNQGRGEIQARNEELTDFEEGSNLDALNGGSAVQADEVIGVLVQLFAALFFDTAEGEDLDTLVLDRFGATMARKPAAGAIGELTFTTTETLVPVGTRVEAIVDGETVTVQTNANATKAAGPGTVTVGATAIQVGRQGNIAAGTATSILDTIPGDASATVTNLERFAGGAPQETDAELRSRVKAFFLTLRRGTVEALRTGSLTVPGVRFVTVDESTIDTASEWVSVYVGDPDGAGNTVLAALVAAELDNWRSAGVEVQVFPSVREEIPLALEVTVRRGSNQAELRNLIEAAVLGGYMDDIASGERWYSSRAESRAHGVDRDQIRGVRVTNPTTETLDPSAPQNALRTVSGDFSIAFVVES